MAVIVLAGVVAGLETIPAIMSQYGTGLLTLDKTILGILGIKALLKVAAHGRQPWRYFADGWNVFSLVIIVICLLSVGGPTAVLRRDTTAQELPK